MENVRRFSELLPLPDGAPAYLGLASRLRSMVIEGRIAVGSRLPSERRLADQLGLSRTTVTRAYRELVDHGWAQARQGSGTAVQVPTARRSPSTPLLPGTTTAAIDLSAAAGPAPAGTEQLVHDALGWLPAQLASVGYEPFGAPHLRARIAAWYDSRGVPTDPEQIIVTPGAIAALNVALRALAGPGARVLLDSPTYPGALDAVTTVRARPVSVALDPGHGLDVAAWTAALRQSRIAAAYLIPDFHNPTGVVISAGQRQQVAAVLNQYGCTAVVDETPAELNLDLPESVPPWAGFDDNAICLGSVSKVLWGGFRVGWLRSPRRMVETLQTSAYRLTLGASALDQLVATSYLENPAPYLNDVLGRMRATRAVWQSGIGAELPHWQVPNPAGGLGLWVDLGQPVSSELSQAAAERSVVLAPGQLFSADRTQANRIRLPLTIPAEAVGPALIRLVDAWQEVEANSGSEPAKRQRYFTF